ncbi:MAG: galactokinase [Treponema sp.]|nr:galactokinase [Treponema sp.]
MKAINDAHMAEYEKKPEVVVKAPGRFHLIGEHSWFFKDKTLSMAVNLPVYLAFSKRSDSTIKLYYKQLDEKKRASIPSLKYKKEDKWANAIKAIVYGYLSAGFNVSGMDVTVYSDILPSSGFGVTTAIKAAAAIGIKELYAVPCNENQILQVMERGNKRFLQTNNYQADNFSALFSKKDNLIITDHTKNSWDYVPYNFDDKKIFLIDTKVPSLKVWKEESIFEPEYALLLGDLREHKNNCYGGWSYTNNITDINEQLSEVSEDVRRKLLSIIREHNNILEAREGLDKTDFFKFARAVNSSHNTMRDMYDVSCPEIDWILKRVSELEPNLEMITNQVACGRITGKGFGRCLYVIIRESDEEKFKEKLSEFEKIFGYHYECYNVIPSEGVSIVRD